MVTSIPFLIARITDDQDFLKLKEFSYIHEGWRLEYDKNGIKIWSRSVADESIKMFKVEFLFEKVEQNTGQEGIVSCVWAVFSGITSSDLFNSLMDPIYRRVWDHHVIVAYDIGYLNSNNTICYYAASCPPPLKSRDFVLQSSWLDLNTEHYMLNHSVCHKDHPPRPGYIRALSHFTGCYIRAILDDGCEMTFVTQTDPQGIIPSWIVNKCTQILAPRFVRQVEKAAYAYKAWKVQNNPSYLPWLHPEQMKAPKISIADCVPSAEERATPFFRDLLQKYTRIQAAKVKINQDGNENTISVQNLHHSTAPADASRVPPGSHSSLKAVKESQNSFLGASKIRKKEKKEKLTKFFSTDKNILDGEDRKTYFRHHFQRLMA